MAGISEEELRRPVETLSVSERPMTAGSTFMTNAQVS
jgi:hypothetical protein